MRQRAEYSARSFRTSTSTNTRLGDNIPMLFEVSPLSVQQVYDAKELNTESNMSGRKLSRNMQRLLWSRSHSSFLTRLGTPYGWKPAPVLSESRPLPQRYSILPPFSTAELSPKLLNAHPFKEVYMFCEFHSPLNARLVLL